MQYGPHLIQIWRLARKYLLVRYKNSVLGIFWSLLNPLILFLIFSFIFGQAFPNVPNYRLFALSGILLWNFFPGTTLQLIQVWPDNAPLLRSYPIHPLVFSLAALVSSLSHFFLILIPFTLLMASLGWSPALPALALLPGIFLLALFTLGLGLFLGALNVFFRDVALLWNTLIPALFYFTPVVYPPELVPAHLRSVLWFNPLAWFILPLRGALAEGQWPTQDQWTGMVVLALGSCFAGSLFFTRLRRYFIAFL